MNKKEKDRLFFHDLINSTHGILLYLNQKKDSNENIELKDIELLIKELKSIQSMTEHQFNFDHKNLNQEKQILSFYDCEKHLKLLLEIYLNKKFTVDYKIIGNELAYFNFDIFNRIVTNLIKNASEYAKSDISIRLYHDENKLEFTIKNDFTVNNKNTGRIKSGIESVKSILKEIDGHFKEVVKNNEYEVSFVLYSHKLHIKKAA